MIAMCLVLIDVTTAASAPAWRSARANHTWLYWDYASIVVPFAVWITLTALGFGAQSLGNLVEQLALVAIIPITHTIRVFACDRWKNPARIHSIIVFAVVNIAATGLRAFVPLIPE